MRTHEGCGGRIARRYKFEWGKVVEQPDMCVGCGGDVEPDAESVAAKGRMAKRMLAERREYEWAVRGERAGGAAVSEETVTRCCDAPPRIRVHRRARWAGRNDLVAAFEVCMDHFPVGLCLEAAEDYPRPPLWAAHTGDVVRRGGLPCGQPADWLVVWHAGAEIVCGRCLQRLPRAVARLALCAEGELPRADKYRQPSVQIGAAGWGKWEYDPRPRRT